MLEFIIIGWTFWFIAPSVVVALVLFYCVADESPGFAMAITLVYILLIQFCSNFSITQWVTLNTTFFIKVILGYIVIGVIYAVFKYWVYLTEKKRVWGRAFEIFLKSKKIDDLKYTFENLPDEYKGDAYKTMKCFELPDLMTSTKNITFWMGYWPWSFIWTMINNPLKWLFEEIKHQLGGLFKGLHWRIIGKRKAALESWQESSYNSRD